MQLRNWCSHTYVWYKQYRIVIQDIVSFTVILYLRSGAPRRLLRKLRAIKMNFWGTTFWQNCALLGAPHYCMVSLRRKKKKLKREKYRSNHSKFSLLKWWKLNYLRGEELLASWSVRATLLFINLSQSREIILVLCC